MIASQVESRGKRRQLTGRNVQHLAEERTQIAQPLDWGGYIIRPTDPKFADVSHAPSASGIYGWYTKDHELMYVGRSNSIRSRLVQHIQGTLFFGGNPSYFSFRLVPGELVAGVENAHIRALEPIENMRRDANSVPFADALEAAIAKIWREILPVQQASLNAKYTASAEQIAARL